MRSSGVLLHPTSLPTHGPIGDLGPEAWRFLDWLQAAGCRHWQFLPLSPVGQGNCPYASPSAFASEPALLSLELLKRDGLLDGLPALPDARGQVDWDAVNHTKLPLLRQAAQRLVDAAPEELERYVRQEPWAMDWACFAVLAEELGPHWSTWPEAFRSRRSEELSSLRRERSRELAVELALQLLLDRQWAELRQHARHRGVSLMGDLPLFVAGSGCEPWTFPQLFELDERGEASRVTGSPPDDFNPAGQVWGSPCYDWPAHAAQDFAWWRARADRICAQFDSVRIDHFRGLVQGWGVPRDVRDARQGAWYEGPGRSFFDALGPRPWVAEDLGMITPDVEALRDELGVPGMKILQFAFDTTNSHAYQPHNFPDSNCVVYTGTHDTDTVRGWYDSCPEQSRHHLRTYLGVSGKDPAWDLIRCALQSAARIAIIPFQDVLDLGGWARMNTPGTEWGNWNWRVEGVPDWCCDRLRGLNELYRRV